jgi:hypothetical protein
VREGAEDLSDQADDIQAALDDAKSNDPDLADFEEKLESLDWGEDELGKLAAPSEASLINAAILALQECLRRLENGSI